MLHRGSRLGAPLLGLLALGCSSDPVTSGGAVDATVDTAVDTATADVAIADVLVPVDTADVADDTARDAADVVLDTTLDAPDARDATLDARADASDAALDARADVPLDASDAALDARADATVDAPTDVRDATLDAPADARDVALDTSPDVRDAAPDAPAGPRVDRTSPQLYALTFRANDADPAATRALGTETAFLDTRVAPRNQLVVYLHGAGAPTTCGSNEHERLLASWGFHVLGPCYVSDYGVGNCGSDIAGCRLEAFEGVDHHPFVNITPPDSIETRVVRALTLLQRRNPAGDWQWYLDGGRPRWSSIIISGISHGASSSGLIAQVRPVARAVMLSGPLDTGQAWLTRVGLTPADAFWGLTHTADPQHSGHVAAFASLRLPGALTSLDTAMAPYGGSHRISSSAMTTDGHGSTQAGGVSPRDAMGRYLFEPAWRTMYGVGP